MAVQFVHDVRVLIENKGELFMHCRLCLQEKPPDVTPQDWARLSVAQTTFGLQVWCVRHNVNVDLVTAREVVDDESEED